MPKVMAKVVAKLRKFFLPYAQSKIADRHIIKRQALHFDEILKGTSGKIRSA
jgi:hypothetical protein